MPKYECDKCAACCKGHLIVEAFEIDALREPRIILADPYYAGGSIEEAFRALQDESRCVLLAGGGGPCMFLAPDNTCEIYPTRPNECVAMQAGDEQCQEVRQTEDLPRLEPIDPDGDP